jgi:hypothetical protein
MIKVSESIVLSGPAIITPGARQAIRIKEALLVVDSPVMEMGEAAVAANLGQSSCMQMVEYRSTWQIGLRWVERSVLHFSYSYEAGGHMEVRSGDR